MVKLLLDGGADPNRILGIVGQKQTALMAAARFGHNEVVTVLLEAGADPNIVDNIGRWVC